MKRTSLATAPHQRYVRTGSLSERETELPFVKGRSKTGGRKPGVTNVRTRELIAQSEKDGVTPKDVLLRSMREYWRLANANGRFDQVY